MEKLVATPDEAARMLATSPNEIRTLIIRGELPAYKSGRNYKIVISQLQDYIETKALRETKERIEEHERI